MSQPALISLLLQRTAIVPFQTYKRTQAALARHRLYPLTVFYTWYAIIVLTIALSTTHTWTALAFFLAGCAVWTLVEYLFHRYVLHGRFPPGKGVIRRFLHERLDPLHWDHHMRPFDGHHISGELKDILPLFFVAAPVSFLFPVYTVPVLLAGVVQSYVGEEWLHYALHFSNSRFPLFRRMKKYHLYHHSPRGIHKGFGITTLFLGRRVRYPIPGSGTPIPEQELMSKTEMRYDGFALVTGASRGLGMAFARALANRHCNLVLVARSAETLDAFAAELRRSTSVSVIAIQADLSIPGTSEILTEQLSKADIPIDLLVNNAGFGLRGEFRGPPILRQLEMLRLNNQAIVELTYSLLPGMLERPKKGIINISSTAGFQPIPFASAYSATKAFLTAFSLALEQELRGAGVPVVTVCPGRLFKYGNDESDRRAREKWAGIYQSPDEVVEDALRVLANGGGLTVPGALNKFSVFAQRFMPRRCPGWSPNFRGHDCKAVGTNLLGPC